MADETNSEPVRVLRFSEWVRDARVRRNNKAYATACLLGRNPRRRRRAAMRRMLRRDP